MTATAHPAHHRSDGKYCPPGLPAAWRLPWVTTLKRCLAEARSRLGSAPAGSPRCPPGSLLRSALRRGVALTLLAALALPCAAAQQAAYQRAISLAPHITELIFAAGAGSHIAGTVSRSDYPAAARRIARVGDGVSVSLEATLALHPDVVLAWYESGAARRLAPALARAGIPTLYVTPRSLDDIPAELRRMGVLFGTDAAAVPAAQALADRIATLRRTYANRRPMRVFIEISNPPLFAVANDPVIDDALRACGGINIFARLPGAAAQVSRESILLRQPEVVIAPSRDPAEIEALRMRWAADGLAAAAERQVYGIDPDQLFRPGPRAVDAAERMCALLDGARARADTYTHLGARIQYTP
ncbi:ABC transporter substrate-binding protein [Pusillimonas sp. TS35]|uniref:helical backbone metal receptor n=1 Tax=Paracandidimonas lactea TaxID=2895524 RepID=UPI0013721623|nr:helical backbone metal receptor [Paracandidimonas lactea]MYN12947.1 ABC transporter substrate-binding protein [Pusillimonas sp. TS35]